MSAPVLERLSLDGLARRGEKLSRHTTMKVGGEAAWWAEPNSEDELRALLQAVHKSGAPLRVLGNGSNLIASDDGFDGVVLHLGDGFAWQRVEGDLLTTGAATLLPKLPKFALRHNLGNMEWTCGIPGSVGGSLWGNAGARAWNGHGFESRDCAADFDGCVAFDREGNRHVLARGDVQFAYRRSSLGDLVVTQATFRLRPLSDEAAKAHREAVTELLRLRRETQPVSAASAGCVWKNPKMDGCRGAGELIEQLGLKGLRHGGAQVSERHGNFVINTGEATGDDVRALIQEVEARALAARGVQLEREARLW